MGRRKKSFRFREQKQRNVIRASFDTDLISLYGQSTVFAVGVKLKGRELDHTVRFHQLRRVLSLDHHFRITYYYLYGYMTSERLTTTHNAEPPWYLNDADSKPKANTKQTGSLPFETMRSKRTRRVYKSQGSTIKPRSTLRRSRSSQQCVTLLKSSVEATGLCEPSKSMT